MKHARVLSEANMRVPGLRKIRGRWSNLLSRIRVGYYRFMGVTIGQNCWISSSAHIDVAKGSITIGSGVNIAGGAYILAHASRQPLKNGQKTVLEDNVMVFVNAVVLPGVKIGRNSVVGAASVVGRNVPPNVVVMGNPARVIKHLKDKTKPKSLAVRHLDHNQR